MLALLPWIFLIVPIRPGIDLSFYRIPQDTEQEILATVSIPYGHLLFEKRESSFEAKFEVTVEIKKGKEVIASDFWQFSETTKDYNATQDRNLKTERTIVLKVPPSSLKVRLSLKDLYSHGVIIDTTISLSPLETVSDLIPLNPVLFRRGKKRILPLRTLSGKDTILLYFILSPPKEVPIVANFLLRESNSKEARWKRENRYSGPFPIEDTLVISLFQLSTGKYTLQATFEGDGIREKRTITFTLYSFNFLSDDEFRDVIAMISYIAEAGEIKRFKKAKKDERARLWKEFWEKRDPTPGTAKNEFQEEYLDRITYANEHFSVGGWPGYRTDRGMVYIQLGPPDEIESYPFEFDRYPYEIWSYYTLNLQLLFIDKSGIGQYELVYPLDYRSRL